MQNYYKTMKNAIKRHFVEKKPLIEQLTDEMVKAEPVKSGRPLGEIILHILRSNEFYLRALTKDIWEPLPYQLSSHGTAETIKALYTEVEARSLSYLDELDPNSLDEVLEQHNRPATKTEILLEMLEHSVQHRGQIIVYYRLLGVEPATIPYIL